MWGLCCPNTIIALRQFGRGKAYYCCKVGDDELGRFFPYGLIFRESGVNQQPGSATSLEKGITGERFLVMVTGGAERTIELPFIRNYPNLWYCPAERTSHKDSKYL